MDVSTVPGRDRMWRDSKRHWPLGVLTIIGQTHNKKIPCEALCLASPVVEQSLLISKIKQLRTHYFCLTFPNQHIEILYSPSQPHRSDSLSDQAGSAHTVKAQAFPIPSGGEGLVYSLRWHNYFSLWESKNLCKLCVLWWWNSFFFFFLVYWRLLDWAKVKVILCSCPGLLSYMFLCGLSLDCNVYKSRNPRKTIEKHVLYNNSNSPLIPF